MEIIRGIFNGAIPQSEGKETDDVIKIPREETIAKLAIYDEFVEVYALIDENGVTEELQRRLNLVNAVFPLLETVVRKRIDDRKRRIN
jgi:hypothetical protein